MIKNQIYLTPQLRSRMGQKHLYDLDKKLKAVIQLFPELYAERLEVGLITTPFIYASAKTELKNRIKICFNPKYSATHFTLGRELTHFVQQLDEEVTGMNIPYGEVQCDVWTIARDELFLDAIPSYLRLSKGICCNWKEYLKRVRGLCIQAIAVRKTKRHYLKWLEYKLQELADANGNPEGLKK